MSGSKCKVCGGEHRLGEPHIWKTVEKAEVAGSNPVADVPKAKGCVPRSSTEDRAPPPSVPFIEKRLAELERIVAEHEAKKAIERKKVLERVRKHRERKHGR